MNKPLAFIPVFIVGALVMFLWDSWYTLLIGMVVQVIAVVIGLRAILTPEFLSADADDNSQ